MSMPIYEKTSELQKLAFQINTMRRARVVAWFKHEMRHGFESKRLSMCKTNSKTVKLKRIKPLVKKASLKSCDLISNLRLIQWNVDEVKVLLWSGWKRFSQDWLKMM